MAGRWIAAFRDVRWSSALSLAPALVEKGKQVWEKVASRRPAISAPAPQEPIPAEIRLPALERRVGQLEEEAQASFEVTSSIAHQHSQLAEQHAELVQVAEVLLQRTRSLLWACAVLAAAVLGLLIALLIR